jgi:UDP-glucuronate 4-epimerase
MTTHRRNIVTERFLLTGALGCIGAWVAKNLVQAGTPPVILDIGGEPRRLRQLMSDAELAQITFVNGDVTDLATVESTLDTYHITNIIHLAALQVPFCRANPPLGAHVNVVGTVNMFEAANRRKDRINKIVYASSVAVYDAADGDASGSVAHGSVGHPTTLYGVYKQANEGTARVYWHDYQFPSIGLRPYIVYGTGRDQGMTSTPTKAMFAAAVGQSYHIPFGGRADYHYADDVAKTFIACARVPFAGAEIFNLRGSIATMPEVIAAIEAVAPDVAGKITYTDKGLPFPDEYEASPLQALLGTLPYTPLAQAVHDTVARYRDLTTRGVMAKDAMLKD